MGTVISAAVAGNLFFTTMAFLMDGKARSYISRRWRAIKYGFQVIICCSKLRGLTTHCLCKWYNLCPNPHPPKINVAVIT